MSTKIDSSSCEPDEPEREPLLDTWAWKQDAASWSIDLSSPEGSVAESNAWWAELLASTFRDFAALARPRKVTLIDEDVATKLDWQPGSSVASFREETLRTARSRPTRLLEVQLQLDLCVWFRTIESPRQAQRRWLHARHTGIEISVQPDTRDGYASLALDHSLFAARSPAFDDNTELHALNQPLLETALHLWQARLEGAVHVQGELTGLRESGFSSDPDDYF